MGIVNWFSKVSKPWQVVATVPEHGNQVSDPADRYGAITSLVMVWEKGFEVHEIRYCGQAINRQQFEDFSADAAILISLVRLSEQKGVKMEEMFAVLSPDDPSAKLAVRAAIEDLTEKILVSEQDATLIVLRRLNKGFVFIMEQELP